MESQKTGRKERREASSTNSEEVLRSILLAEGVDCIEAEEVHLGREGSKAAEAADCSKTSS